MSKTLEDIARELIEKNSNSKVKLIYAFNGSGKTRLSKEFQNLISPKNEEDISLNFKDKKIIYFSAFTEDLFFWDNDLKKDAIHTLKIQQNQFTDWILRVQGQENNIIDNFQRYTNNKLTPKFNENYSQVTFSFERGNDVKEDNIKISKGEESCFIWSIFYSLFEQIISVLNIVELKGRETPDFNNLEYIFIDDPVSSLDENHLIELAVNISSLIKESESDLKFIITTHNPLFYNILCNEFSRLKKDALNDNDLSGFYRLISNRTISSLFYIRKNHVGNEFTLSLFKEKEIKECEVEKYHFNLIRNILEKLATFLGYREMKDMLPQDGSGPDPYMNRIVNLSSHSKHSGEETILISDNDKRVLKGLVEHINTKYNFRSKFIKLGKD